MTFVASRSAILFLSLKHLHDIIKLCVCPCYVRLVVECRPMISRSVDRLPDRRTECATSPWRSRFTILPSPSSLQIHWQSQWRDEQIIESENHKKRKKNTGKCKSVKTAATYREIVMAFSLRKENEKMEVLPVALMTIEANQWNKTVSSIS